jgi:putative transposase
VQSVVVLTETDQVWKFISKYVWIHGETMNAYLLAVIDCYSKEVVDHYFRYHCKEDDVKETMATAFDRRDPENISAICMRRKTEYSSYAIQLRIFSQ